MHAGQSYGRVDNSLPIGAGGALGFPDTTIFNSLSGAGVSGRYFFTDIPVSALWGVPGLLRSSQVQAYYEQAATGTLPALSFVDPAFNGEDQGTSGDEDPHRGSPRRPGSPLPGLLGSGGGDTGAVALSPCIAPGAVSPVPYNHYSMLRSVEDIFGLRHLGYAALPNESSFGADIFTRRCRARVRSLDRARHRARP